MPTPTWSMCSSESACIRPTGPSNSPRECGSRCSPTHLCAQTSVRTTTIRHHTEGNPATTAQNARLRPSHPPLPARAHRAPCPHRRRASPQVRCAAGPTASSRESMCPRITRFTSTQADGAMAANAHHREHAEHQRPRRASERAASAPSRASHPGAFQRTLSTPSASRPAIATVLARRPYTPPPRGRDSRGNRRRPPSSSRDRTARRRRRPHQGCALVRTSATPSRATSR